MKDLVILFSLVLIVFNCFSNDTIRVDSGYFNQIINDPYLIHYYFKNNDTISIVNGKFNILTIRYHNEKYNKYISFFDKKDTMAVFYERYDKQIYLEKDFYSGNRLKNIQFFNTDLNNIQIDDSLKKRYLFSGEYEFYMLSVTDSLSTLELYSRFKELNISIFSGFAGQTLSCSYKKKWDTNGKILQDFNYDSIENQIKFIVYYPNGFIKTSGNYRYEYYSIFNEKRIYVGLGYAKTGFWCTYYDNGNLESEGCYYKDKEIGLWKYFSKTGEKSNKQYIPEDLNLLYNYFEKVDPVR